jgi:putative nucleotidyltransferase with HDIG domain
MTTGAATCEPAAPAGEAAWQTLLARVNDFPTLPVIVDKIADLVRRSETTAKDIENVVATDQTLTARLLRLVNSPFYGFPQKITTISRAVGVIGFEALRNLAFSTSVITLFSGKGSDTFAPEEFWKHSIGTAIAAKELARCLGEKQLEDFFVAGLVHDIGKLVHHEYLRDAFEEAGRLVRERDILLREAEEAVLHFTHDQTAAVLLKHWRLPPRLVTMVGDHHRPGRTREAARDAAVIHLADILSRAKAFGSGGDGKIPRLERTAWDVLGLTFGHVEQVMARMDEEFRSATAILAR